MVLDEILAQKRIEVASLKKRLPLERIAKQAAKNKKEKRSLSKALSNQKTNLICELKKASPSEGVIRKKFKPLDLAREYESAGAAALSVLTEKHYFQGDPKTLKKLRSRTNIPLLRKDFIFDRYQVYETALLGADAFLIITMLVSDQELAEMLRIAKQLGLEALVEVHTEEELDRAIQAGSKMIGINNRNLRTLNIDLSISERLMKLIPKEIIVVIESGIEKHEDIAYFQKLGARNFLVGTALMKSQNLTEKVHELLGR